MATEKLEAAAAGYAGVRQSQLPLPLPLFHPLSTPPPSYPLKILFLHTPRQTYAQ